MDTTKNNPDAATFLALAAEFTAVVGQIEDWSVHTPCADWQAADLVRHVIDTQTDFFAERGAPLVPAPPMIRRWPGRNTDLGQASGRAVSFSAEEMATVETSIAGFRDMLYSEGICHPPVRIAAEASRQDRILAQLGRQP